MDKGANPPSAEQRRNCWNARDQFLACARQYSSEEETAKSCLEERKAFEASCPSIWVSTGIPVMCTRGDTS